MQCPGCGSQLRDTPHIVGQMVACPHCQHRFTAGLPAVYEQPNVVAPPPLPEREQPIHILVNVPSVTSRRVIRRPAERLQARGWFSRAFASSTGFGFGCLLVWFTGFAVSSFLGWLVFTHQMRQVKPTQAKLIDAARRTMEYQGATRISDNPRVYQDLLDPDIWHVAGTALMENGRPAQFDVSFVVGEFDGTLTAEPTSIVIDGRDVMQE